MRRVAQEVRLQCQEVEHNILALETDVTYGRHDWYAVLTVEASFTACGKFVLHERIERISLLCQPLCGSTFDAFIAGETMSRQVLLQGGTQATVAGFQIRIVWIWSKGFRLTFCGRF
jgi:hypothetical protein